MKFDRARNHAIQAVEHQGVVTDVAVQGVGHHRIATQLEVLEAPGLLVADMGYDAPRLIDGEHGVEGLVLGNGGVDPLERIGHLVAQALLEGGLGLTRLVEVLADHLVERELDEMSRASAGVVLEVPGHDLTIRRQALTHGTGARAVVHAHREIEHKKGSPQNQRQYDVPEA